jgi:hypothetical protein
MDFADEPYVRKYTRKTVTSRLLGWEGRMLGDAMLGEFDRSGVFDFRGDIARAISAVTDIPEDLVRIGLARMVETETWIVNDRSITWPTHPEAQHCVRSDRLRQQASRAQRNADSVTSGHATSRPAGQTTPGHEPSQPVTASHTPSQPVTASHTPSQPVTPSHATSHTESQPVTASHEPSQDVTLPVLPSSAPIAGHCIAGGAGGDPHPPLTRRRPRGDPKRAKARTPVPVDLEPNATDVALAKELGVDLDTELPKCIDHHQANGSLMADWHATLRTWIRKAPEFRPTRGVRSTNGARSPDDRLRDLADRREMHLRDEAAAEQAANGAHP